jgi:proton-dependent oligopeptide transporter, POT family
MSEQKAEMFGHPRGLSLLFATEMWERFNFYGMRALLTLFLVNALAFKESDSSFIYGGFLGLCYLTPILGGFISDRFLGNRNCILLGGLIMSAGQLLLFFSASTYAANLSLATTIMYGGLLTLIIGNGLFKPNISSMVGQLYKKGDNRLDAAFTVFYMGINLGAFLGMLICSLVGDVKNAAGVRDVTAFKWGFLAAAIAMFIGVLVFYFFKDKFVVSAEGKAIGAKPNPNDADAIEQAKFSNNSLVGTVLAAGALMLVFHYIIGQNWIYSFIFSSGISLAGLILTDASLTTVERQRIISLYCVAFFVMFFWACFEQAGSSLTFIADKQTDTNIMGWAMPPSLVQNANSLFIVIFAPIFSAIWLWMGRRNMEPISPVKQAIGLGLLAIGFLVIALRMKGLGLTEKMGVGWLVGMYLLHTLGELCLSPIGLSLVAKLAPLRFSSLLMGVWFLANAGGYALAGSLGATIPPLGDKYEAATKLGFDLNGILNKTVSLTAEQISTLTAAKIPLEYPSFAGITIHNLYEFLLLFVALPGAAAILLLLISPWLKKMMNGVN